MEEITISMEEYKDLLMTKGKYDELKSRQSGYINPYYPSLTKSFDGTNVEGTTITCNESNK